MTERAAVAGWRAFCDSLGQVELCSAVADAVTAADPIIRADELRWLATTLQCPADVEKLRTRADELDPT